MGTNSPARGTNPANHLSGSIDTIPITVFPPKCAEVGHTCPVGASDKSMLLAITHGRKSGHLSGSVDIISKAITLAQSTQVDCRPAVKVNKERSGGFDVPPVV